jgi:hypothetical protein
MRWINDPTAKKHTVLNEWREDSILMGDDAGRMDDHMRMCG